MNEETKRFLIRGIIATVVVWLLVALGILAFGGSNSLAVATALFVFFVIIAWLLLARTHRIRLGDVFIKRFIKRFIYATLALAFFGGLLFLKWQEYVRVLATTSLREHLADYLIVPRKTRTPKPEKPRKVIIVDTNARAIDKTYFDLPDEIRARTSSEVDTVIQVNCETTVIPYEKGWISYHHICLCKAFELKSGEVRDERTIANYAPKKLEPLEWEGGVRFTPRPDDEIVAYATSLTAK